MQKSLVLFGYFDEEADWCDNSEELNNYLASGYKVVSATPMGAYGYGDDGDNGFASLVIIEKPHY